MQQLSPKVNIPPLPSTFKNILIGGGLFFLVAFLVFAAFIFVWYFCRIEVESGRLAVLIKKTGRDLPSGQILAASADEKGIQKEVLPEGRYFRNPYHFGWEIHPITDIPAGKLGVQLRLFGEDLAKGHILAEDGMKGILGDTLSPGKYRINPYAFQVQMFDAIEIRPGHGGVVTSLVGKDVQNATLTPEERNTFLVPEGFKGVIPGVLDSGTYYLNPYQFSVFEVNLQSQRFEMSGQDAISFLTLDGFTVNVEGTIEFRLDPDTVALLTHRVGDMEDIITKVILPRARGFSRIEGSKHPAVNYIIGETRQQFEDRLKQHLQKTCEPWGVDIFSVLIRNIIPPDRIASVIRERELAVQDSLKYGQQINAAKSRAELVKQEKLAVQSREKVEAETARMAALIGAEKEMAVQVLDAQRELDVASIDEQAAEYHIAAMLLEARARQQVIAMENAAEAEVIKTEVQAFGGGMNWARHAFYLKVAPRIQNILSGDQPQNLGGLLSAFLPQAGKGKAGEP